MRFLIYILASAFVLTGCLPSGPKEPAPSSQKEKARVRKVSPPPAKKTDPPSSQDTVFKPVQSEGANAEKPDKNPISELDDTPITEAGFEKFLKDMKEAAGEPAPEEKTPAEETALLSSNKEEKPGGEEKTSSEENKPTTSPQSIKSGSLQSTEIISLPGDEISIKPGSSQTTESISFDNNDNKPPKAHTEQNTDSEKEEAPPAEESQDAGSASTAQPAGAPIEETPPGTPPAPAENVLDSAELLSSEDPPPQTAQKPKTSSEEDEKPPSASDTTDTETNQIKPVNLSTLKQLLKTANGVYSLSFQNLDNDRIHFKWDYLSHIDKLKIQLIYKDISLCTIYNGISKMKDAFTLTANEGDFFSPREWTVFFTSSAETSPLLSLPNSSIILVDELSFSFQERFGISEDWGFARRPSLNNISMKIQKTNPSDHSTQFQSQFFESAGWFKTRNIGNTLLIIDDESKEAREVPNLKCFEDSTLEFSFE